METILFVLWFFLPAGMANMAPVFAAKISALKAYDYPMDFFLTYKKKRVFGDHKTMRGLVAGIVLAVLTVYLQQYFMTTVPYLGEISPISYQNIQPVLFGTLCAVGALFGDAIKSFFKRQIGVAPGKTWFPFDQLDYILGSSVATYLYLPLPIQIYLLAIVLFFLMHLLFTYLGFVLGLKESPL